MSVKRNVTVSIRRRHGSKPATTTHEAARRPIGIPSQGTALGVEERDCRMSLLLRIRTFSYTHSGRFRTPVPGVFVHP